MRAREGARLERKKSGRRSAKATARYRLSHRRTRCIDARPSALRYWTVTGVSGETKAPSDWRRALAPTEEAVRGSLARDQVSATRNGAQMAENRAPCRVFDSRYRLSRSRLCPRVPLTTLGVKPHREVEVFIGRR